MKFTSNHIVYKFGVGNTNINTTSPSDNFSWEATVDEKKEVRPFQFGSLQVTVLVLDYTNCGRDLQ